jgi:hypothetical protein
VDCNDPPAIVNGYYTVRNTTYRSQAVAMCIRGYWFSDRSFLHVLDCQEDATWSQMTHVCEGEAWRENYNYIRIPQLERYRKVRRTCLYVCETLITSTLLYTYRPLKMLTPMLSKWS